MNAHRHTLFAAPLALLLAVGGCQSGDSTVAKSPDAGETNRLGMEAPDKRVGLVPQSRPPVADLPVPVGFKLAESMSRSYESAGARLIDHTFKGRADKFDVQRFYRQQMPLKGWTFRGEQMVRGTFQLQYEKAAESCVLTIAASESSISIGDSTTITLNVQTLGRGEPRQSGR